ncbi:hypothetical protein D3C86_2211490 [compost metagenome]
MAGSGLTVDNLDNFIKRTGVKEVHLGTGVRVNGSALQPIDPNKLITAAEIVSKYSNL